MPTSASRANRKFVIKWNIENFRMFGEEENNSMTSSVVVVPFLDNSGWYLKLLRKCFHGEFIYCYLCRTNSDPENIKVSYQITMTYNAASRESSNLTEMFGKNSSSKESVTICGELYFHDMHREPFQDILKIECCLEMCDREVEMPFLTSPYPVGASITSTIPTETSKFFTDIENVSEDRKVNLGFAASGSIKLYCIVRLKDKKELMLEVCLQDSLEQQQGIRRWVITYTVGVCDIFRKKRQKLASNTLKFDGKTNLFPIASLWLACEKFRKKCVPDDKLTLYWEIGVSESLVKGKVPMPHYYETNKSIVYDNSFPEINWRTYLEHKYYEHPNLYRLLTILIVLLSIMPHIFFDSIL